MRYSLLASLVLVLSSCTSRQPTVAGLFYSYDEARQATQLELDSIRDLENPCP